MLYYTKGSGGNGVNTVYFLDTTGQACPNGVGLPRGRPAAHLAAQRTIRDDPELPSNMCILKGFNTTLAQDLDQLASRSACGSPNPDTLYVADEGNGTDT